MLNFKLGDRCGDGRPFQCLSHAILHSASPDHKDYVVISRKMNRSRPKLRDVALGSQSCEIHFSKYLEKLVQKKLFSTRNELLKIKRKKGQNRGNSRGLLIIQSTFSSNSFLHLSEIVVYTLEGHNKTFKSRTYKAYLFSEFMFSSIQVSMILKV